MPSLTKVIEITSLSVGYGGADILREISFEVNRGEIIAVIGPNGSGKTTLIKAMLGLLPIHRGEIMIFGRPVRENLRLIGYLPQNFSFDRTVPITVGEFLGLSAAEGKTQISIDEKLAEVDMLDFKNYRLAELSGGQLQRVLIARAILNDPKILIMDEPVTGIDVSAEKNFYQLIRHLNKKHDITVVFISHELELVYDFADQVICLNKTLVCRGVPRKVLTPEKLEQLYGGGLSHHQHWHEESEGQINHHLGDHGSAPHNHHAHDKPMPLKSKKLKAKS